jgi:hypothetical protein
VRVLNRSRSCHFTRRKDDCDSVSDWNFISSASRDICQSPRCGRFDLYRSLVGFDFHERLAFGNRFAFGFEPFEQSAGLLCHAKSGHDDIGRQITLGSKIQHVRFKKFV